MFVQSVDGQTGRNADKIPRHTSKDNYVHMVLHCALALYLEAQRHLGYRLGSGAAE